MITLSPAVAQLMLELLIAAMAVAVPYLRHRIDGKVL